MQFKVVVKLSIIDVRQIRQNMQRAERIPAFVGGTHEYLVHRHWHDERTQT